MSTNARIFDDGSDSRELPTSPTLLFEIDDALADLPLALVPDDVPSYGRNLSMDWSHPDGPRFRLASGNSVPVIVSGPTALAEDVTKIMLTPRYDVPIYSDDYGSEVGSLRGLDAPLAIALIPGMVEEALLQDDRVQAVENLEVSERSDGGISVTFSIRDFNGGVFRAPAFVAWYGGAESV